jgi:enolase-phosphatase E1
VTVSLSELKTRALLLDIEGTTTPIDFVYNVLFRYARTHVADYLQRKGESAASRTALEQLIAEQAADRERGADPPPQVLNYIRWLMDCDRKSPGLKALQGLIWQEGYESGELHGQVYADVPPALARWRHDGLEIYIYSSGSVLAQKLLFASTDAGDLTKLLNGYFDTEVGPKVSPDSYVTIAAKVQIPPNEILFVSDVAHELDAARTYRLGTALCVRDADAAAGSESHPVVRTFDDIVN